MLSKAAPRFIPEQLLGELAAGHPAHVQFEQARVVGRRGDRKAAPAASRQQDVDVLTGQEVEALRRGQPQEDAHDIVRPALHVFDAARQTLDLRLVRDAALKCFDRQIAVGARLTEQDQTLGHLGIGEPERPAIRIVHLTVQQAGPTGAAVAALAAMRQIQSGIERSVEDRLPRSDTETPAGLG